MLDQILHCLNQIYSLRADADRPSIVIINEEMYEIPPPINGQTSIVLLPLNFTTSAPSRARRTASKIPETEEFEGSINDLIRKVREYLLREKLIHDSDFWSYNARSKIQQLISSGGESRLLRPGNGVLEIKSKTIPSEGYVETLLFNFLGSNFELAKRKSAFGRNLYGLDEFKPTHPEVSQIVELLIEIERDTRARKPTKILFLYVGDLSKELPKNDSFVTYVLRDVLRQTATSILHSRCLVFGNSRRKSSTTHFTDKEKLGLSRSLPPFQLFFSSEKSSQSRKINSAIESIPLPEIAFHEEWYSSCFETTGRKEANPGFALTSTVWDGRWSDSREISGE